MKKSNFILICIVLMCVSILGYKIYENAKRLSIATESAIRYVESEYPGYDFYIVGVNKNKDRYYIDLKVNDKKYELTTIKCRVMPTIIENGYYRVKIWSTTNIDSLAKVH